VGESGTIRSLHRRRLRNLAVLRNANFGGPPVITGPATTVLSRLRCQYCNEVSRLSRLLASIQSREAVASTTLGYEAHRDAVLSKNGISVTCRSRMSELEVTTSHFRSTSSSSLILYSDVKTKCFALGVQRCESRAEILRDSEGPSDSECDAASAVRRGVPATRPSFPQLQSNSFNCARDRVGASTSDRRLPVLGKGNIREAIRPAGSSRCDQSQGSTVAACRIHASRKAKRACCLRTSHRLRSLL